MRRVMAAMVSVVAVSSVQKLLAAPLKNPGFASGTKHSSVALARWSVMSSTMSVVFGLAACAGNAHSRWQQEQEQWMLMVVTLLVTIVLGVLAAMVLVRWTLMLVACWQRTVALATQAVG